MVSGRPAGEVSPLRDHGPSMVGRHFPDEGKEFDTVFQRKLFHDFDHLEFIPDMRVA